MSKTIRIGHYLTIAVFISLLTITGCGPKQVSQKMITDECTPSNLEIKSNDGLLSLKWDTNCSSDKIISGYYIYLQEKPIKEEHLAAYPPKSIKPFNLAPYPGDTDPEDRFETMDIQNLENGIEYYLSVRTVFPDKTLSVSSNQVAVICRPEGEFELAFRYAAQNDGFSFADGEPVRADSDRNDLYFYSKDGFDFIASPERLNGFLRKSSFYSLGKTDDIYQYPALELEYEGVEKIPAIIGESYLLKTADGRFVKIRIEEATGEKNSRVLRISYIYQTIPELQRF